ncbi:hypothetical protein [Ornithinimicrobium sp. Y1694]|uniref:hypothetical protein n=1 Tax=Ornithinimicrobium sp. Y1694 TaxID=3418590 RepID=UPI003CEBE763
MRPHHQPLARGRARREKGLAALELLIGTGFALLVFALALQLFSAIYTGQAAGRAAWDAARAQSLGQSASAAASRSLPGGVELLSVNSLGDGVEIKVRAPAPLPWPKIPDVTRRAHVP